MCTFHNYCNCSNTRISVLFITFKEFSTRRDNGLEKSSKCFWPNSPIDQHLRLQKRNKKPKISQKRKQEKRKKKIERQSQRQREKNSGKKGSKQQTSFASLKQLEFGLFGHWTCQHLHPQKEKKYADNSNYRIYSSNSTI